MKRIKDQAAETIALNLNILDPNNLVSLVIVTAQQIMVTCL